MTDQPAGLVALPVLGFLVAWLPGVITRQRRRRRIAETFDMLTVEPRRFRAD